MNWLGPLLTVTALAVGAVLFTVLARAESRMKKTPTPNGVQAEGWGSSTTQKGTR